MQLAPGSRLAGYRILRLLGQGGSGAVYLAQHPRLPRQDALKVLTVSTADGPFRDRFLREGDIVAGLRHPNIVTVYDRGSDDGRLWLSMQHIEGCDVDRLIEQGAAALSIPRIVSILTDVADALDYAHRKGLLHLDVKPANIIVTPPTDQFGREMAMLTDFGISQPGTADANARTQSTDIAGTVDYMAPEQLGGRALDTRADVYALGGTLHHMLTGAPPFPRSSNVAIMTAHVQAPPPVPTRIRPGLPAGIDRVVARAMAKDPAQRYASCRELAADARRALLPAPPMRQPPAPLPVPPPPPPPPPRRTRGWLVAGAALVVVAVVGVAVAIATGTLSVGGGTETATTSTSPTVQTTSPVPRVPTARASNDAFTVTIPRNWRNTPLEPPAVLSLSNQQGLVVSVSANEPANPNQTLQSFAEEFARQQELQGAVIDPAGIVDIRVDGELGKEYGYSNTLPDGSPTRGATSFVLHDDLFYAIFLLGSKEASPSGNADYQEIIRSWKWTG